MRKLVAGGCGPFVFLLLLSAVRMQFAFIYISDLVSMMYLGIPPVGGPFDGFRPIFLALSLIILSFIFCVFALRPLIGPKFQQPEHAGTTRGPCAKSRERVRLY